VPLASMDAMRQAATATLDDVVAGIRALPGRHL
jgi:hypothetical protein